MENINPITAILIIVFMYPIIKGFIFKYSSRNMKLDMEDFNRSIAFISSLYLGVYYSKKIFIEHEGGMYRIIYETIPKNIINYIDRRPFLIYIIVVPIFIYIIYKLFYLILHLLSKSILYPLLDVIESSLRKRSSVFKSIIGAITQVPKSIAYILLVTLVLNIISIFYTSNMFNKYLQTSYTYNYICKKVVIPVTNSKLARKLPDIINNSFKIVIKETENNTINSKKSNNSNLNRKNTIVYYNGITLNEGIKSSNTINKTAISLVKNEKDIRKKASILYNWVGSNIRYDYNKAEKVLENNFEVKSGAIEAFNTKKGICFDYACLYVAMCRANNIKVRLVTGEGFNGVSWVSHAWNQVYVSEEGKWINVDTTFYRGGNYFDSKRFELDHKNYNIAGEW